MKRIVVFLLLALCLSALAFAGIGTSPSKGVAGIATSPSGQSV